MRENFRSEKTFLPKVQNVPVLLTMAQGSIEFLREKHDQRYPKDIEAEELNEYLCEFILSVK